MNIADDAPSKMDNAREVFPGCSELIHREFAKIRLTVMGRAKFRFSVYSSGGLVLATGMLTSPVGAMQAAPLPSGTVAAAMTNGPGPEGLLDLNVNEQNAGTSQAAIHALLA